MTTIGILGAGQLGRMLALGGYPLGLRFRFLDPAADSPAGQLAPHIAADYYDGDALARFVDGVDVVTYEFENVPVEVARKIEQRVPVYPPPLALEKGQDRLVEKNFFRELGIPTPGFSGFGSEFESGQADAEPKKNESGWLKRMAAEIGFPAVLKTRRMGYDGKGQFVVGNETDLAEALKRIQGQDAILEQFVTFEREVSILAVRGRDGAVAFYPLTVNTHREGILRLSVVPTEPHPLQAVAESYARAVAEALDYVGVLAIEFFEKDGRLLANEMAPRVHNSGHWTIEGAVASQFENHVRAVSGLPLGSTSTLGAVAMLNLIGSAPEAADILKIEGAHLHLYGKSPRPGRKIGHVTVVAESDALLAEKFEELNAVIVDR